VTDSAGAESGRKAVAARPPAHAVVHERSNTPEPVSAPPAPAVVQLFTRVSDPADADEREAEAAATTAGQGGHARVHLHRRSSGGPRARLARKCASCTSGTAGSCCSGDNEKSVQRRADSSGQAHDVSWPQTRGPPESEDLDQHTPTALSAVEHGGRPLPHDTRASAETLFSADFSGVRVHDHPAARQAATLMRAEAYTVGSDIAFAAGKFDPATAQGRHLLHHELSHVVQQGAAPDLTPASVRGPPVSAPTIHRSPDESPSAWSYVTSAYSAVKQDAATTYEAGKAGLRAMMVQYAPEVLEFIETDHVGKIRNWLKDETDGKFGPLKKLITCGQVKAPETQASPGGGGSTCTEIASAATGALRWIGRYILMPQLECGKAQLSAAGWALSAAWDALGAPAIDAIKKSETWKWISEKSVWLWEHSDALLKPPLSGLIAPYFPWLLIPDGARDWLIKKAAEAWDAHKSEVTPYLPALKQVGEVLLTLTGFAPMIAAYEAGSAVWPSLVWLVDNWTSGQIIVSAREQLHTVVIPNIMGGVGAAIEGLEVAAMAVDEKLTAVQSALDTLVAVLGDGFLSLAAAAVGWLAEQARELAVYLRTEIATIKAEINARLLAAMEWALMALEALRQLSLVMANPLAPWIMTAGAVWLLLPDCLKGPIIDLILDLLAAVVSQGPPFEEFAEAWGVIAPQIIAKIDEVRAMSVADRVAFSNTIAKNMAKGGGLEIIATAIRAAIRSPDLFVGQVEKELMGTDLTKPLPFERGCANLGGGPLPNVPTGGVDATSATLTKIATHSLTESDVTLSEVVHFDLEPELLAELTRNGGSMEFDGNPDAAQISDAQLAALLQGGGLGGGGPGNDFAQWAGLSPDEQLAKLMDQPMPSPCGESANAQPQAGGAGKEAAPTRCMAMPEADRLGPFTEAQRAQYVFSQMKKGVAAWWECNKSWVVPAIFASILVLAVLAFITEGAAIELLLQLFTVLGAIFLAWSILRASAWLGVYAMHSVQGNVDAAAEALARAEAIVAIELIFILLFEGPDIAKGFSKGLQGGLHATGEALAKPFTEAGKALTAIPKTAGRAVANVAKNVGRAAEAIARLAENGKIWLKGLGSRIGKGTKSVRALAADLSSRPSLFKKFRLYLDSEGAHVCGVVNPCVPVAKAPLFTELVDSRKVLELLPAGASANQAKRVEDLLNRIRQTGSYDEAALKEYFLQAKSLDKAIDNIAGTKSAADLDLWVKFYNNKGTITPLPPKGDPKELAARARRAHDIGVEHGKAAAMSDLKLAPTNFDNPIKQGAFGQGFDDIMHSGSNLQFGEVYIVEYKGGLAQLAEGQMSEAWVVGNINRLRLEGGAKGQYWADVLSKAMREGRLRGVAYSTPIEGNAALPTKRIGTWVYPKRSL
jgi:hypothetical protein